MVVLGAGAGGGFPQWNSNAPPCRRAREGDPAAKPRTQASLAVSADGRSWILLNASPDINRQIAASPFLYPQQGLRSSPIAGVVLTGGDVDAIAGLLTLRERQPFTIYATGRVLDVLKANPIFEVLAPGIVERRRVALEETVTIGSNDHALEISLFAVPGKVPLYLEVPGETPPIIEGEETVGVRLRHGDHSCFFIPGCAATTPALADRLRGAELVFFDGTLWDDEEMIRLGIGPKSGGRMGHMSVSGPAGTIAAFASLGVKRKILIHINNSNPILLDDTPERAAAEAAGWDVAYDGMEFRL
jgi:pyrroloquinoline quinone biosynthesis protein B